MRTAKAWRRGILAAAVTGAGVLAATAASGATTGATTGSAGSRMSPASTSAYPTCPTSHLKVWRPSTSDGAAGSVYWALEFANVSGTTCTLTGFPRVAAVDGSGHQLGSAAGHDSRFSSTTIVVRPGTTAHALLRITDVGAYSASTCGPVRASGLRVYPPNTTKAAFVPLRFSACSRTGPIYLHVRVVRPRAGIPGYSQ